MVLDKIVISKSCNGSGGGSIIIQRPYSSFLMAGELQFIRIGYNSVYGFGFIDKPTDIRGGGDGGGIIIGSSWVFCGLCNRIPL